MKIYKLEENINKEEPCKRTLKITDVRQGVKNPNRVNVFIDGKFSFSLDIAQVVEFKLKVGLEVSEDDLVRFKNASEYGKLYQRALEWVLVRPRSIKETRDYLNKKLKQSSSETLGPARRYGRAGAYSLLVSLPSAIRVPRGERENSSENMFELLDAIISRLIKKGYLNDKTFAEWYVENRFVKKGISKKRLKMELMKKGVSGEIIDEALEKRNDEEEILKVIAKKRNKYDDDKLISYLCRQGFSFELVRNLVQTFEKD